MIPNQLDDMNGSTTEQGDTRLTANHGALFEVTSALPGVARSDKLMLRSARNKQFSYVQHAREIFRCIR